MYVGRQYTRTHLLVKYIPHTDPLIFLPGPDPVIFTITTLREAIWRKNLLRFGHCQNRLDRPLFSWTPTRHFAEKSEIFVQVP